MIVQTSINFNGKEILTNGKVLGDSLDDNGRDCYLVEFYNKRVEFRGLWDKNKCKVFN